MPAISPYIIDPIWEQFEALLPERNVDHPLGCHNPRIPDKVVFGWSSRSSYRSWSSAALTKESPTRGVRQPPCAVAGTSGSPLE